jgi:hypothetical protein
LHIEVEDTGDSGFREVLSAAEMRFIPVVKHDSGWSDLRLRVVGIVSLHDIQNGHELLSCYHTLSNASDDFH